MATANPIPEATSTAKHAAADLLVLATAMQPEELEGLMTHLAEAFSAESVIVATQEEFAAHARGPLRVVPISRSSTAWTMRPADFINAFEAGHEHEAKAVLMLGPGADSLSPLALRSLASAVLHAAIDLAMPHYSIPPNTGFINSAILYPLTRTLFAARARFPLALDLCLSMRMAERMATVAHRFNGPGQNEALLWPVNEAIAGGCSVDEIDAGLRAMPQPADVDISSILALVTGSLFGDIEAKAAVWQRPRRPVRRPPAAPPTWHKWLRHSAWPMPTCRRSGRWFCRPTPCSCSSGSRSWSLKCFACPKTCGRALCTTFSLPTGCAPSIADI